MCIKKTYTSFAVLKIVFSDPLSFLLSSLIWVPGKCWRWLVNWFTDHTNHFLLCLSSHLQDLRLRQNAFNLCKNTFSCHFYPSMNADAHFSLTAFLRSHLWTSFFLWQDVQSPSVLITLTLHHWHLNDRITWYKGKSSAVWQSSNFIRILALNE